MEEERTDSHDPLRQDNIAGFWQVDKRKQAQTPASEEHLKSLRDPPDFLLSLQNGGAAAILIKTMLKLWQSFSSQGLAALS